MTRVILLEASSPNSAEEKRQHGCGLCECLDYPGRRMLITFRKHLLQRQAEPPHIFPRDTLSSASYCMLTIGLQSLLLYLQEISWTALQLLF
jgi:hypothetical protein